MIMRAAGPVEPRSQPEGQRTSPIRDAQVQLEPCAFWRPSHRFIRRLGCHITRLWAGVSGSSTARIARQLGISESTMQDHPKSTFEQVRIHGWHELINRIFLPEYWPGR
jgi:hypothetical protein